MTGMYGYIIVEMLLDRIYLRGLSCFGFFTSIKLTFDGNVDVPPGTTLAQTPEELIFGPPATFFEVISHFPEIILSILIIVAWVCSPFYKINERAGLDGLAWRKKIAYLLLIGVFVATALLYNATSVYNTEQGTLYVWYDSLISDYFIMLVKLCLLVFSTAILLVVLYTFDVNVSNYWVFLLVYTLLPAFIVLVSVNDLLSFFAVIEYISLIAYTLPAIVYLANRGTAEENSSRKGIESSVKYYSVGAIASVILMTGVVFVATEVMSFNFDDIELWLADGNSITSRQFFGFVLILCALAIKVAVFPGFAWVFDVYRGASYTVLLIFAILSKLSIVGLFVRFYMLTWVWLYQHYTVLMFWISLITMVMGAVGAFCIFIKDKVKPFIGYTGVNQLGYIFIGLCILDSLNILNAVVYYLVIYLIANLLFISSLAYFSLTGYEIKSFGQLSLRYIKLIGGNAYNYHKVSILVGISVWAIAGLPPFCNFFAKMTLWSSMLDLFFDFFSKQSTIDTSYYLLFNPKFFVDFYAPQLFCPLALIILIATSIITSIISMYYYLGIVGCIISSSSLSADESVVVGGNNISSFFKWKWIDLLYGFANVLICLSIFAIINFPLEVPLFFVRII